MRLAAAPTARAAGRATMYVWKNQNHRDRRKRPRPPMGYKAAPPAKVDMSSRVERDEQLKIEARRKFAEQEEHEVRIQTRDIKQLMDDYLRTKHGRQELLHVADAMRREQERAEALKKKQEQEAEEEKKRAAAEEKELEKAYKQREKKEASKKKAQHKAREKLRRKGLLAEDAPTAEMFEEKFFDVSLTEVPEKKRKRIIQELRAVTRFSLKQATDAAERVTRTTRTARCPRLWSTSGSRGAGSWTTARPRSPWASWATARCGTWT